jgi:hypothetical protein
MIVEKQSSLSFAYLMRVNHKFNPPFHLFSSHPLPRSLFHLENTFTRYEGGDVTNDSAPNIQELVRNQQYVTLAVLPNDSHSQHCV